MLGPPVTGLTAPSLIILRFLSALAVLSDLIFPLFLTKNGYNHERLPSYLQQYCHWCPRPAVSNDFFASAENLILVEPAISLKGQFGPNGASIVVGSRVAIIPPMTGALFGLGTSGSLIGFDIDTSHFNGNEAPAVSVDAFLGPPDIQPAHDDARWIELLAKMDCGPNAHLQYAFNSLPEIMTIQRNLFQSSQFGEVFERFTHSRYLWHLE
ncbi:hypothetical protein BDZ89DRAFT_1213200 [Hymenopellis radicata]|nr:hypothetical protein BDZ89DRAFT_1213200 [Hymenopellis radicata]